MAVPPGLPEERTIYKHIHNTIATYIVNDTTTYAIQKVYTSATIVAKHKTDKTITDTYKNQSKI